jgi:hypothetical protein
MQMNEFRSSCFLLRNVFSTDAICEMAKSCSTEMFLFDFERDYFIRVRSSILSNPNVNKSVSC